MVGDVAIQKLEKLERVRCSRCQRIRTFTIEDCEKLTALDFTKCHSLKTVTIKNCNNLRALDLSLCDALETLNGEFPALEYLSMPFTQISKLPPMPKLKYIDVKSDNHSCFKPSMFPELEVFIGFQGDITLSEISSGKLRLFQCIHSTIRLNSIPDDSNLEFIRYPRSRLVGDKGILEGIILDNGVFGDTGFDCSDYDAWEYQEAQKLLYGPWGVPPIDRTPAVIPPAVYELPNNDKLAEITDGILGTLMGNAYGDAIGVCTEFTPKLTAHIYGLGPLSMAWSHAEVTWNTAEFLRGTSTDDTSQAILIMRMFATNSGKVNQIDFAKRIRQWVDHGHSEHKHEYGLGTGRTTLTVVGHRKFRSDPVKAAYDVWAESKFWVAPNGAVMRTSPCGVLKFWDEDFVIASAKDCALVTHASPLCVYSCVAICLLISRILQTRAGLIEGYDIDDTLKDAAKHVDDIEKYEEEIEKWIHVTDIADLTLGIRYGMGYTMRTCGAAIWALRNCSSIEEAVAAVYREGGDADTNLAVVGAVMGAKYGYSAIPQSDIDCMFEKEWLLREIRQFIGLMGMTC